jgi:hypothetical protein
VPSSRRSTKPSAIARASHSYNCDAEELAAVKTRIGYQQLLVSEHELIALMRQVAATA